MFMQGTKEIENANLHFRLHNDLIEYLRQLKKNQWKNAHILMLHFYQQDHWKQSGEWVFKFMSCFGFVVAMDEWKSLLENVL